MPALGNMSLWMRDHRIPSGDEESFVEKYTLAVYIRWVFVFEKSVYAPGKEIKC